MIHYPDDPHQLFFTSRSELVTDEPLVACVDQVVRQLDLSELHSRYSESGAAYYDPAMQLKVLFFAYCDGVRSCRQIEKHIKYDLRYQYYTGSLRPDFRTIDRFRRTNLDLLPGYFVRIVCLCQEAGLVDGSTIAIDGTRLRASCSNGRTWNKKRESQLAVEIHDLLQSDSEEQPETDASLPMDSSLPAITDPDARFMKTSDGTLQSCYNAQIAVDTNQIIVAADVSSVSDDSTQYSTLVEQASAQVGRLNQVLVDGGYYAGKNLKHAERHGYDLYIPIPCQRRTPGGQFTREDFTYDSSNDRYYCPASKTLLYKQSRNRNEITRRIYRASSHCCSNCLLKAQCTTRSQRELNISEVYHLERSMTAKLASARGQRRYTRRKSLVEPVFGNLKFNLKFDRFLLRTLPKVCGEFHLMCIAHNLKKLASFQIPKTALAGALYRMLVRVEVSASAWGQFGVHRRAPEVKLAV